MSDPEGAGLVERSSTLGLFRAGRGSRAAIEKARGCGPGGLLAVEVGASLLELAGDQFLGEEWGGLLDPLHHLPPASLGFALSTPALDSLGGGSRCRRRIPGSGTPSITREFWWG